MNYFCGASYISKDYICAFLCIVTVFMCVIVCVLGHELPLGNSACRLSASGQRATQTRQCRKRESRLRK